MRLIDARALKEYMCSTCPNQERCRDTENVCSTIADIAEQPTVEAVGKERFHEAALEVLHSIANEAEFMGQYDNADRALRVFVNAIVLGTLEHRLFGGKENASD